MPSRPWQVYAFISVGFFFCIVVPPLSFLYVGNSIYQGPAALFFTLTGIAFLVYSIGLRKRFGLKNWWLWILIGVPIFLWLALILLASLNCARCKGPDAGIMANLDGIRAQAEMYYGSSGNTYGTAGTSCTTAGSLFVDNALIAKSIVAADTANGRGLVTCNNSAKAYAVEAQLVSARGMYWCIDSTGVSARKATALGTNTVCPTN